MRSEGVLYAHCRLRHPRRLGRVLDLLAGGVRRRQAGPVTIGPLHRRPGRYPSCRPSPGAYEGLKGHATTTDPWLQGIGLAFFVLGLALAIWARLYLGRNWGMPMSQKVDPELITTGPYHSIRHPIYSGIILAMIGTAIAVSVYWLVAVVLLGAYFVYSAVMEERLMTGLFPGSYPEYKRSTKMLIPFIF